MVSGDVHIVDPFAIMGESPPSKCMAHCTYTAATNALKMMGESLMTLERVLLQY
jgi:hypothetical protein